jgi:hypothetical protein
MSGGPRSMERGEQEGGGGRGGSNGGSVQRPTSRPSLWVREPDAAFAASTVAGVGVQHAKLRQKGRCWGKGGGRDQNETTGLARRKNGATTVKGQERTLSHETKGYCRRVLDCSGLILTDHSCLLNDRSVKEMVEIEPGAKVRRLSQAAPTGRNAVLLE